MNKIFYLDINNTCNNNCKGCAVDPSTKESIEKPFEKIMEELEEGLEQGYRSLHLIGGETTLHTNFFRILKAANSLYPSIYITSNGRIFSYEIFTRKLRNIPVKSINITLAGPNKEIHEAWTRTPGSFEQTIEGMRNLLKAKKHVCLNMIIWNGNIAHLDEYLSIITELRIMDVGILNLVPLGRAKKNYHEISADLPELAKMNDFLEKLPSFVEDVDIEDFSPCIFSQKHIENGKFHFQDISTSVYVNESGQIETLGLFAAKHKGYPMNTLELNKCSIENLQKDISDLKTKELVTCRKCGQSENCKGTFKEYVKLKGKEKTEVELSMLIKNRQKN